MSPLASLIIDILNIYIWVIIANAVFSWLVAFGIVNLNNDFVRGFARILDRLTSPLLRPIQRIVPSMGGLDLSPVILILGIFLIQRLLVL